MGWCFISHTSFQERIRIPFTPAILNSSSNCTIRLLRGLRAVGPLAWREGRGVHTQWNKTTHPEREKERETLTHRSNVSSSWPAWVNPAPLFNTFTATCLPDLRNHEQEHLRNTWTCASVHWNTRMLWCEHSVSVPEVNAEPYSREITPTQLRQNLVSLIKHVSHLDWVIPTYRDMTYHYCQSSDT